MKVKELMTPSPVTVSEEATLEEAARILLHHRYGGLPVVDGEGKLKGILQVEGLLPHPENVPFSDVESLQLFGEWVDEGSLGEVYRRYRNHRVGEVMRRDVPFATPEDSLGKVLKLFLEAGLDHLPVVDEEGKVVGILSRSDLLKLILSAAP
ncbi:MAG: CBS domain-containing protein [Thermaceae bacterium]